MTFNNPAIALDRKEVNRMQIEELTPFDAPSWIVDLLLFALAWLSGYL
jgi:hypothetical protein